MQKKDLKDDVVMGIHVDKFNIPSDFLHSDNRKESLLSTRLIAGPLARNSPPPPRLCSIIDGYAATRPKWEAQWNHLNGD
jgi:hypothetical protein